MRRFERAVYELEPAKVTPAARKKKVFTITKKKIDLRGLKL